MGEDQVGVVVLRDDFTVILNDAHATKINVKNRMVCAFQGKGRHIEPNNHHIVTV